MQLFTLKQMWRGNSLCKTAPLALLFFLLLTTNAFAQMSSSSYKIPSDSLNAGGQQSSSGLYNLVDTAGELGTGDSASGTYAINAGFLSEQATYISITAAGSVSMSPSISGVSGGTGSGSMSWTVVTDSAAGYALNIHSTTTPAMRSAGSSFADYTPAGSDPDFTWSVASTDSEFGFTPEGADVISRFKDNGSICNSGSSNTTDKCWDAITTSDTLIAQSSAGNHPSGTLTTVKVQAESGTTHIQPNGSYTATIVATAVPL